MAKIGFIGLGHMGTPMVKNLLLKGHHLTVFDLSKQAMENVLAYGASLASSIKEVASEQDVIFTMLQTGDQVKKVCLDEEGIFNSMSTKCLYIDSSSIDVATCRLIHKAAAEKNLSMLDAPVSGGVSGAEKGALTFMVGGDENYFYRAKEYLECLGKKIIYAGAAGNGQVAKICNNMILGVSMIAVSEGFVLAKNLGLDPKKFFEIASNASGQCWSLSQYCPMPGILENAPSNKNFEPGFAASMMLKDLRLSQEAALDAKIATPMGAEATALYSLFVGNGNENIDFSGIIKMIAGKDVF